MEVEAWNQKQGMFARYNSPIARLRSKGLLGLIRSILLRVWPSSFTRAYYRIRYWDPVWHGIINKQACSLLKKYSVNGDGIEEIVAAVKRQGIYVTDLETLFHDRSLLPRLQIEASRLLETPEIRQQIEDGKSQGIAGKYFLVRGLSQNPVLDLGSELIALNLNERILGIVNGYLGMFSRLKYFDLWYNLPMAASGPAVGSQRWHRDWEDKAIIKVFLYLVDVDQETGPFTYIRESHNAGRYKHLFPQRPPQGSYPAQDLVERVISPEQVQVCTGKAGTIIFCDTSGLHKGGRCEGKPRILSTAFYTSNASHQQRTYRLASSDYEGLSPAARYAIGLQIRG